MRDFTHIMAGVRAWLSWLPGPVASSAILLVAAVIGALTARLTVNLFLRIPGRRGAFVRAFAKEIRRPLRALLALIAVGATLPVSEFPSHVISYIAQVLLVLFILLMGWSASLAARIASTAYINRFKPDEEDNLLARKHITQVGILRRAMDLMIFIVTISAALMTFEPVRQYGLSLFASAGAASLIVGLAARPLLTNLIAGVQIAITQPIRMEDAVIVEGEWGWIEEIASTYVVVRLWDWRRMILPIAYFLEKPFQNWTHQSASLIGTVFFNLDYTVPVKVMREKLMAFAKDSPLWDGKVANLQVSDTTEHTVQIRMLISARNAPQTWDLRCEIREKMLEFLQDQYPGALPRTRIDFGAMRPAEAAAQGEPPFDQADHPRFARPALDGGETGSNPASPP